MKKPNLLFIYTDEQAFNTLACYGNSQIEMPNLNRLAERGNVLENAYVTQPVCTPSRSSLLTGLYPHTNGCIANNIPLRENTLCLPEMFADENIVTAHHGKWHLGDEIFAQHGFDDWVSIEDAYRSYYSPRRDKNAFSSYHKFLTEKGFKPENGPIFSRFEAARLPEELTKAAFVAGTASDFIRNNKNNRFVLYVNFLEPHMPFTGPRDNQYDPDSIPLPENFNDGSNSGSFLKNRVFAEMYRHHHSFRSIGTHLDTERAWRRLRANYWGLCGMVDTQVGRVLDALEETGLDENTIIVFTSDHGDMMGSHGLAAKCVMYEEAVKVPMLIALPGRKKGRKISGAFSQIDLVPTLLDLMGENIPGNLEGKSRKDVLESACRDMDDDVFIEWNGPNSGFFRASLKNTFVPDSMKGEITVDDVKKSIICPARTVVTSELMKLTLYADGFRELYDLREDPCEKNNIADIPSNAVIVGKLSAKIKNWQFDTEDPAGLLPARI